ncbi:MAG: right-handed parallel beta-helix repeat-containing protein [Sedimentisphaerales bacterium]|nr:right-handed parallel beta-helix repeat-containing protein [Sedimentisphaerales bacterium]
MNRYRQVVWFGFWVVAILFLSGQNCQAEQQIRRIGDFYVSARGDDANPGTRALPFATLQRARDEVGKHIRQGLTKDIVVLIQDGTYYLPYGITFGPEDSGTDKYRITYAAYGQDIPVLTGGVKLDEWEKHQGHIYVAEFPKHLKGTQFFEDGVWMPWARTPNEGYFKLVEPAEADGKLAFTYHPEDMNPARWDISDAQVNLWPYHDWFNHTYSLAAVDTRKKMLVLDTAQTRLRTGNRYYVRNLLELLDVAGECYISRTQGKIYVWPRALNIRQAQMVLSTAKNVICIRGTNDQPVENLHLEGLDIGICEENAVDISNAQNCSIQYCTIENAGVVGVMIHDRAQQVRVQGNRIRYHGQHGVSLQGRGPGPDQNNHHNIVENNHIHHCGRLIGHGYGVRISQSGHNQILHNHIHHMPRYGVSVKGARYKTIEGKVEGMTWENRYDYMPGRNNRIAYNDIHNTNLDSQDTGAIESWGSGRDNTIDHNLIHDTGNREFNLQSGIYLDDQADYWTVTNNIIYGVIGTDYNQCIYTKGIGNHIENNILIGSSICDVGIRSFFMADERCDHHSYLRNIFYFEPAAVNVSQGSFGSGVGNLQNKGSILTWRIKVPIDGDYYVWLRYACHNAPYGLKAMDGRTEIQVDKRMPVLLNNLPDTGDWGKQQWSQTALVKLASGVHTLQWTNTKGGGINLDALVLANDPVWKPDETSLPKTQQGKHVLLIQAEDYTSRDGVQRKSTAYAYGFVNWSDDRITACDFNLFYDPGGQVSVKGSPADGSMDQWKQLYDSKFDVHSIAADPGFKNVSQRDFSLAPDSPALQLGFKPIDISQIGLKEDFPSRFEKE